VRGRLTISIKQIRKKADLWDGKKVTKFLLKNCFCEKAQRLTSKGKRKLERGDKHNNNKKEE